MKPIKLTNIIKNEALHLHLHLQIYSEKFLINFSLEKKERKILAC